MIEADKMLHLRRYLTFIVRSQLLPSRCRTINYPPRRGGYVLEYLHPRNLRPEIYIATCNRTYGTTVPQSSHSDDVEHKLMSFCDDVKKGRVSADGLKEVIGLCSKNDYQLPHDIGVLLLKCCGNLLSDLKATERDHLASQVLGLAKKSDGALTLEYYNTLLSVNEENSTPVNPNKFLEDMSVEPDENTYLLLLNAAIKAGNSDHLWDILSIVKDKSVTVYEGAINALVQICMSKDNIVEVEKMITLMREAKLSTAKAYTELACGYARLGDIPNLVKILNEEPQDNMNLLRIIKVLSISNNGRHIPVVLNFLIPSVSAIKPEISKTIAELIRADQASDAHNIINCLAMNNVTKDVVKNFVNSFMNELIVLNVPIDDIIKYANDFVDSGCNQQALTDVAEIGLKLGREKLCLAVFEMMRNKNIEVRSHYYWPLLARAYHKGEAQVYTLVKAMLNAGVEIDSDTLIHYVYPHVNTANPIIPLQRLLLNDVSVSMILTPLLSFLLRENRLQDIALLCSDQHTHYKVHYKELMKPLVHAYLETKDAKNCIMLLRSFSQGLDFVGLFLKALIKVEYPIYIEDLQLLLEELINHKIMISEEDATILKNRLQQNKNFNLTPKVTNLINILIDPSIKNLNAQIIMLHSRYMSTKELACYVVELKSSKASTKRFLHKLVIAYCNENNFKKAEEIIQEHDACQYEWTPNMKSILFELYAQNNKLNEAEALLQNMPNGFKLDKNKIVIYATALVKARQSRKAFNFIDTFDAIDRSNIDVKGYCCTLLQELAQGPQCGDTGNMLSLLLKKNYCEVSVELLRPLVMIPLEKGDILGAVDVLTECAYKYHEAPLALEVLTTLLEQKHSSLLHNANNYIENVYDVIVDTYSVKVANTLLALALGTLNQTEKLQTLLQKHQLSMKCLAHYYIRHIRSNYNLDGLQNIVKVTSMNENINKMCEILLTACSKVGDCNRALELWKIMCTRNITPSVQFEKNFIQFLLSNKIPLPPELDRIKEKDR